MDNRVRTYDFPGEKLLETVNLPKQMFNKVLFCSVCRLSELEYRGHNWRSDAAAS